MFSLKSKKATFDRRVRLNNKKPIYMAIHQSDQGVVKHGGGTAIAPLIYV